MLATWRSRRSELPHVSLAPDETAGGQHHAQDEHRSEKTKAREA
jgi:hypothetical protein